MGNCISLRTSERVNPVQPITPTMSSSTRKASEKSKVEDKKLIEKLTEKERVVLKQIQKEERESIKQKYNLERLRKSLNEDMEMFLLNNILFSVQFFQNFDRDRSSFTFKRLREESRMNAEGPGGGLSSSRHKKRASLPDTMQEIVGRWVRLDPPILNSPTFPAKPNEKVARSKSAISLSGSTEKLSTCRELLAPLRIMIAHEDVRIVEREGEDDLYRAIIPEPIPKMAGYLKLRCIGNWPEETRNEEIYDMNFKEREALHGSAISEEAEYAHSSGYNGSQKAIDDDESEYSYLCKKLYDKTLKDKEYAPEVNSSESSICSDSDHENLDSFDTNLSPGEKLLAGIKKRGAATSILQRPPMKPPHDLTLNSLQQESEPHAPYAEDLNPPHLAQRGRRDSGTVQNLPIWPYKTPGSSRMTGNFNKNNETQPIASTSKESENWKLGKTSNFGNIYKRITSPKPSISTENSDSDYGYATIPPSHSPQQTGKRHGGIPHQCLTKVRYRHIEGEDDEEFDLEGEELARRIEEQGGDLGQLFITKTFLNPSKFHTAFAEEVQWRDYGYSSTNGDYHKSSSVLLNTPEEHRYPTRRQHRNSKASVDSGNSAEEDDDSLQTCLGIPASVPITASDTSWFSQKDIDKMRFPIEIIPSITIPWPHYVTVSWMLGRNRKAVIIDERTKEERWAWPGKLVREASRTMCHAIVPPNLQRKNLELPKTHLKQEQKYVPDLGWKICFCEAERVLEKGLTHAQTRCLLFALLLRRCYLQWDKFELSQNFVRTAFYWQCEKGNINWPEEEMGYNLKAVLALMYRGLRRRKLRDYFIDKKNIAKEELPVALPKAQNVLHSMEDVLSIHVARAISGLQFSDSRVPKLDFRRFVDILTDEHAWMTLNPELFGMSMATNSTSEDEEDVTIKKVKSNESLQVSPKEGISQTKPLTKLNPPNSPRPTTSKDLQDGTARPSYRETVGEFLPARNKYKINEGIDRGDPGKEKRDSSEIQNPPAPKITKIKVVKGIGTLNAKKQQQRPEVGDAFSRLKKTDKNSEWYAQLRKQLHEQKMKDKKKGTSTEEPDDDDMFAKAETYKPEEVLTNPAKRRLLLSFFANHFEQLGRRCGRDWGAIRVADSYLRHAENLAKLLAEHEGVASDYEDDDGNMGEAKHILDRIKREFEHLTNLRARRNEQNSKSSDGARNTKRVSTAANLDSTAKSMPNLSGARTKGKTNAGMNHGSSRSLNRRDHDESEELSSEDVKL